MVDKVLHYAEPFIFGMQGMLGLLGIFLVVLTFRKMRQKRFRSQASAREFLETVRAMLAEKDYDGIVQLCDSPAYWSKAVPQLILVAMANKHLSLGKLNQLIDQRFEREVIAELSYLHLGMAVVAKTAPLVGLLGTVTGIVGSFSVISGENKDPNELAKEIGLALMATMGGLVIAIPMTLLGGYVMVKIGRLNDEVHQQISEFLIELKGQHVEQA
jgi:biopolymer transport protein ExbB/TolQ